MKSRGMTLMEVLLALALFAMLALFDGSFSYAFFRAMFVASFGWANAANV